MPNTVVADSKEGILLVDLPGLFDERKSKNANHLDKDM